jgi:hypothetical protein
MNDNFWNNQAPPSKCECNFDLSTSPEKKEKQMTTLEDLKAVQELIEFLDKKVPDSNNQLRILALTMRAIAGHGLTIEYQGWI